MSYKIIDSLERLNNDREGNPRWRVNFTDGTTANTAAGYQIGYSIDNSEFVGVPLELIYNGKGEITRAKPVK
jgi:hypothetical protein